MAETNPLNTSLPGEPGFDFANLLFSGPCNAGCPFCIGGQLDPRLHGNNLDKFPPRGLEAFIELIRRRRIPQVVLTGSNTDPQLYRHEAQLLERLRAELPEGTQISLHTNGRLALRKLDVLRRYDRLCISFPSFNPDTYRRIMGVSTPPDLEGIVVQAGIPVKVSCVLTRHNLPELPDFLKRLHDMGVRRLVLRKVYQADTAMAPEWDVDLDLGQLGLQPRGAYRGNPLFEYNGLQVTLWDFAGSGSQSINLFSSGLISREYLLVKARYESSPL